MPKRNMTVLEPVQATRLADEACDGTCAHTYRSEREKKALANRCSRIEGQLRGIKGMIDRDAYCDDLLNQISAVQAALSSMSRTILKRHMETCVIERIQGGEPEVVDELMETLKKLMR